jgi:hypothetical protein
MHRLLRFVRPLAASENVRKLGIRNLSFLASGARRREFSSSPQIPKPSNWLTNVDKAILDPLLLFVKERKFDDLFGSLKFERFSFFDALHVQQSYPDQV